MMMIMMNCFSGMVDRQETFSLISSWDHCQRSSPSWISDMPWAEFRPAQNLSSSFVEWLSSGDMNLSFGISLSYSIYNCFWIILLWIFRNLRNYISNFITNQITSCFCCFLNDSFWRSFKCIYCRLFSMITKLETDMETDN